MADEVSSDEREPQVVMMDRGTQFNGKRVFDWYGFFCRFAKLLVLICGMLCIFVLHRMKNGTMPCICTNELPCLRPDSLVVAILRRVLRK